MNPNTRRSTQSSTDVVIIGGGPAGLAAAIACSRNGLRTRVIERGGGLALRDRNAPIDIASGVGGAGLFSDGKFSFHPSATRLWLLEPLSHIKAAYHWFGDLVSQQGLEVPPFPDSPQETRQSEHSSDPFARKSYASKYLSLDSRFSLVDSLARECGHDIRTGYSVVDIQIATAGGSECAVDLKRSDSDADSACVAETMVAPALIVASGRLGPLLLQRVLPPEHLRFRRFEIGVRIEQPALRFFLRDEKALDPKFLFHDTDRGYQWRTFCCCRNGEVVPVIGDSLLSVSGRSDVAPTGLSSVGFHVRVDDATKAIPLWDEFRSRAFRLERPLREPLEAVFSQSSNNKSLIGSLFGPTLAEAIFSGIHRLRSVVDHELDLDATLYAPAIEGFGDYPDVGRNLQLSTAPVWVVGDACGLFRGLTAALVSGYFAGLQVADYLQSHR